MVVSAKELSEIIGVTYARLMQLQRDGIVIKIEYKKYDLAASVKSFINYKMKHIVDRDERSRFDRLKADKLQKEIELMDGEIIHVDIANEFWGKIIQAARSRILSIPKKTAPLVVGCKSAAEAEDILTRVTNEALRELSSPDLVEIALGVQVVKRKQNQKRKS